MSVFKLAFAAAILLTATGSALAQPFASPEGTWEIESQDSRYKVTLCGDDALCGELIWLGNGADNAENLPYLNTLLIDHAAKAGDGVWKGQLKLFGQTADGTITQTSDTSITLQGCAFGIICKSYHLLRID